MTRKLVAFLTALLVVFGLTLAAPALALHAIQDEESGTISLDRADGTDNVPEQASGVATFRVQSSADGFYSTKIRIRVDSLPKRAGRVYEAWLVADDSGYELNLGAFDTDNDGDGELVVTHRLNNLVPYNKVIVSTEDRNDLDPDRDGPVILEGTQN